MFRVRIQALWGKSKSNHNANKHDIQMHTNIAERTRSDREREYIYITRTNRYNISYTKKDMSSCIKSAELTIWPK